MKENLTVTFYLCEGARKVSPIEQLKMLNQIVKKITDFHILTDQEKEFINDYFFYFNYTGSGRDIPVNLDVDCFLAIRKIVDSQRSKYKL